MPLVGIRQEQLKMFIQAPTQSALEAALEGQTFQPDSCESVLSISKSPKTAVASAFSKMTPP